ncbi:GntR family transcriptional regulator [Streptomyces niveus]|uniref:GntR family transcriptional regulator n=1 Tax=Streptomyces niveus TaxID=193462 RepID=UPI003436CEE9
MQVAGALKAEIANNPDMKELPRLSDVMSDYGVSRGLALRAFRVLWEEGLVEAVPGARWKVIQGVPSETRRPLTERVAALTKEVGVGNEFFSASALSTQFGVSRPTISKALAKLEADGLLTAGGQGRVRKVRALPTEEEQS